jgi:hypothetical protein
MAFAGPATSVSRPTQGRQISSAKRVINLIPKSRRKSDNNGEWRSRPAIVATLRIGMHESVRIACIASAD